MEEAENSSASSSSSTTSCCSSSASDRSQPISRAGDDHLFSILLLLPVESILSFSSTCKKFRTLACSDVLWESVCRREWGPASVDALRSSYIWSPDDCHGGTDSRSNKLTSSWIDIYRQVSRLDSIACHSLSGFLGGQEDSTLPSPRASHSLNFVSDSMVLFGGGCEGGRHLDDTWVAYIGRDFRRKLIWQRVNSGLPSGRFGHTCVVVGNFLVLFGGINDHGNRQNDTWIGQLAFHETLGISIMWRLLEVGSTVPPARGAHAACCVDGRKIVIHGGIGLYGLRLGDTWVLELSDNLCFGMWHEFVVQPSPPARSGHSLTWIGGARAVLFGGRGLGYEVLNDVWLLDISRSSMRWVQLLYEMHDIPQGVSLPRVGHSATLVLGGWLLIYGGEDSLRRRKNDFWVLNTKEISSQAEQQGNKSNTSNGLLASSWKRLNSIGYKPSPRSFHRVCSDHLGRYLYVFGGMVDGLLQPAAASGLRFDGELFLVELLRSRV
ncbi:hypothetical protein SAY86_000850 [Trapa natans]|uniref:F-box domain-containing protein n=1 Tax=Trapa natans TaxID=22666 RepID=A0AAN7MCR5_TRANT|nr:hypothetical protein SAY86_000850 [Trapa natans]